MKFKIGETVKVNNLLNLRWDDEEQESKLIGKIGTIIEAKEGAFPYQVKFDNEEIQKINIAMGSRLFDEYELDECIIEACYQCKYCVGNNCCTYFKISKDINNVTKIPKWCPLKKGSNKNK